MRRLCAGESQWKTKISIFKHKGAYLYPYVIDQIAYTYFMKRVIKTKHVSIVFFSNCFARIFTKSCKVKTPMQTKPYFIFNNVQIMRTLSNKQDIKKKTKLQNAKNKQICQNVL